MTSPMMARTAPRRNAIGDDTLRTIVRFAQQSLNLDIILERCLKALRASKALNNCDRRPFPRIEAAKTHHSGILLSLPSELLIHIFGMLDPASALCLALTCRTLYLLLDIHVYDIRSARNWSLAWEPNGDKLAKELRLVMQNQLSDFARRLERDLAFRNWHQEMEMQTSGVRSLACGACFKVHDSRLFSRAQQDIHQVGLQSGRKCLAAEATITLCEHAHTTWRELLDRRRAFKRQGHATWIACPAGTSCQRFSVEVLRQVQRGCMGVKLVRSLIIVPKPFLSSREPWREYTQALQSRGELPLCHHFQLRDGKVGMEYLRAGYMRCQVCDTRWTILVEAPPELTNARDFDGNHNCRDPNCEFTIRVETKISGMDDPWSDEFLSHVNGGEQLRMLRDSVNANHDSN